MRQYLASLLIAGLSLLTAACEPRPSLYADNQAAETHDVKVLAGDRLVIDGQPLTLADAETPHPAGQSGCRAEALAGAQAADTVRSLVASARHLEVRATDRGGELRLVNLDGLDLGQALIAQNLAVSRQSAAMDWCFRTRPVGQTLARSNLGDASAQ
jgi:endonuclease YncB( thermonuclease family)